MKNFVARLNRLRVVDVGQIRCLSGYLVWASGCAMASETWALVDELQAAGATSRWRRICTSVFRTCDK